MKIAKSPSVSAGNNLTGKKKCFLCRSLLCPKRPSGECQRRKSSRWKRWPDPTEGRNGQILPMAECGRDCQTLPKAGGKDGQTLLKVGGKDGQTLLNTEAGRVSRPYPRPKSLGMAEAPWAECLTVLMPHHITDEGKLFRQGPFFLTFCMSL